MFATSKSIVGLRPKPWRPRGGLLFSLLAAAIISGCTPSAREDVGAAGAHLDNAATKSAVATDKVIDNADKKVEASAKVAGQEIKTDTAKVGADFKAGADKVGTK